MCSAAAEELAQRLVQRGKIAADAAHMSLFTIAPVHGCGSEAPVPATYGGAGGGPPLLT